MKELQEARPLWHALLWIAVYVGSVNITSNLTGPTNKYNLLTAVSVFLLGILIFWYVKKNSWLSFYGFRPLPTAQFRQFFYFIPFLLMILSHFIKGISPEMDFAALVQASVLMTGVGFVEEVLFRGFLFQAILAKSNVKRAVIISGVTFGLGHIVNIFQNYSPLELVIQITAGIVLGMILALMVNISHTIIPGIVFHILLNIGGTITAENVLLEGYIGLFILIVSLLYLAYLLRVRLHTHAA